MFASNETLESARARNIRDALMEDVGTGDWTAQLASAESRRQAEVIVREEAVLCGRDWFEGCFLALDADTVIHWKYADGDVMIAGSPVCNIEARGRAILTAERSALNFLQLLSGVATVSRQYARAVAGASPNPDGCVVLDTRKTVPGLRQAQKYAVRVGGGGNQRLALWDGILIKENHIAAAGGIGPALAAATALDAGVSIQVEVENLEQLEEALAAGATSVLLDNMDDDTLREACRINAGRALLEASGGVAIESVRRVAATGVHRISTGMLTKDLRAVDFSLRMS